MNMIESQCESADGIAEHYGWENQKAKTMEELDELEEVLELEDEHDENDIFFERALIEEIADVEIMLEQLKYLEDIHSEVEVEINTKLDRQLDRIANEGENGDKKGGKKDAD